MNPPPRVSPFFALALVAGCGGIATEPVALGDETQEVGEPGDDPAFEEPMSPVELPEEPMNPVEGPIDLTDSVEGPAAGLCTCGAEEYFIELALPNETLRFTLPSSPASPPHSCGAIEQPFFFLGGTCTSTMLAACDNDGRCIVVRPDELTIVSSDGSVLLALKAPFDDYKPFIPLGDGPWTNDAPIVGEISIREGAAEIEPSSIAAPVLPLRGRYSLCYAGGDFCLR